MVTVAIAVPGLYFTRVTITTRAVVEVANATGEWPLSDTPYAFEVQPCGTYQGWWSSPTACTSRLSNPMDRFQNVSVILVASWTALVFTRSVPSWTGSNVTLTNQPARFWPVGAWVFEFGPQGALVLTIPFETPDVGGQYANALDVGLQVPGNATVL